jgi:hypothetical protein
VFGLFKGFKAKVSEGDRVAVRDEFSPTMTESPLHYDVLERHIEKLCSQCGLLKPLGEFNRRATARDGHASECRPCHRKRVNKGGK